MSDKFVVKILLLGDGTVGKSQFLIRYADGHFDQNFIVSIGVATKQKTTCHKGNLVKVQVWDAAGNDQFRSMISPDYYKAAHGVMIVYDITNQSSFEHVQYWKEQVDELCAADVPIVVVGNKTDLVDAHMVSLRVPQEDEDRLSSKLGVPFCSASAKSGEGVDKAFAAMVDLVFQGRFVPLGAVLTSQIEVVDEPPARCACAWWRKRNAEEEPLGQDSPMSPSNIMQRADTHARERAGTGFTQCLSHERSGDAAMSQGSSLKSMAEEDEEVTQTGTFGQAQASGQGKATPDNVLPIFPLSPQAARDCQLTRSAVAEGDLKKTDEMRGIEVEPMAGDARRLAITHVESEKAAAPCQLFMGLVTCSSCGHDVQR